MCYSQPNVVDEVALMTKWILPLSCVPSMSIDTKSTYPTQLESFPGSRFRHNESGTRLFV
jgi:hypothetical protein